MLVTALDQREEEKLLAILKSHGVLHAGVFGSVARGESRKDSDLDILVELPEEKSLLDLVDLKLDLEDALGRKVDVVTYRSLDSRIRDSVLAEEVVVL